MPGAEQRRMPPVTSSPRVRNGQTEDKGVNMLGRSDAGLHRGGPMRFEATYYQPSGWFQPVALLHVLGAMLLGAIAGCGYQYLNDLAQLERFPASTSLPMQSVVMLILVAFASLRTETVVRVGHVRHHRVAVLVAVAISLSIVLASYA